MDHRMPEGIASHLRTCRKQPAGERDRCYLELMTIAVFKGGLNYSVVNAKWDAIREAFFGFDVERVASMSDTDVQRVERDPRVIHNKRKIEGVVHNALEIRALQRDYGGFAPWLDSIPDPETRVKELHRRFMFMGPTTAYYFLHYSGETVPGPHEWGEKHPEVLPRRMRKGEASKGGETKTATRA